MTLEIKQMIIPKGRENRTGITMKVEYITIHETANLKKGAGALNHAKYFNNPTTKVSPQFVNDDKEIYQVLPDNEVGYHAGDGRGKGNFASIGIESCVNSDTDITKTRKLTAKLTVHLMRKHNVPLSKVVQHNKWSGKNCPTLMRANNNKGWNEFIGYVKEYLNEGVKEVTPEESIDWLVKEGVINSPNYWKEQLDTTQSLGTLFTKLYKRFKG